jgi:porphobilinogen deaminase
MNDARRKEIQRAQTLIEEAKGILIVATTQEQDDFDKMPEDLQNDDEGEKVEDAVDALERAATCCDDAIAACEEAQRGLFR